MERDSVRTLLRSLAATQQHAASAGALRASETGAVARHHVYLACCRAPRRCSRHPVPQQMFTRQTCIGKQDMATVWDDDKIFRLIELFQKNRILWDSSAWTKDYRNKTRKLDTWAEIAKLLKVPTHDVESKMHTLRSQFARERKKAMAMKPAGVDMAEVEKSIKWKFYDALKFLPAGPTRGFGNDGTTNAGNPNDYLEVEFSDESRSSRSTSERSSHPAPGPSRSRNRAKRRSEEVLEGYDEWVRRQRIRDYYESKKDEFDFYGQYVASELRQTTDDMAVLQAKHRINTILVDLRLGKYRRNGPFSGDRDW
ncbi:uncharacterized protein LOC114358039 isoform X2 [Ostrinia furnacalis]|uniref:uncharacterized protein LOC114358039 isoform X2 n=1 Tax=Ostrinia furnacalis TaxID=93504 RepID=UPI0010402F69|nr:uncharacterized protein LOC114358039 isoform X2 [Ostrinia furnacalis]